MLRIRIFIKLHTLLWNTCGYRLVKLYYKFARYWKFKGIAFSWTLYVLTSSVELPYGAIKDDDADKYFIFFLLWSLSTSAIKKSCSMSGVAGVFTSMLTSSAKVVQVLPHQIRQRFLARYACTTLSFQLSPYFLHLFLSHFALTLLSPWHFYCLLSHKLSRVWNSKVSRQRF